MRLLVLLVLITLSIPAFSSSTFSEALRIIKQNYISIPESDDLEKAAIKGIVNSLDKYSTYVDKKDVIRLNEVMHNQYVGIGVEITVSRKCPMILNISSGSPAEEVGLKPGDILIKSGKNNLCDLNIKNVRELLSGKEGSVMELEIERDSKTLNYVVSRKKIKIIPYSVELLNDVAYIRINHFTNNVADNIKYEYGKIKNNKLKGIILDLRFNPGGLFDQAVKVSSLFLPHNTKVVSFNLKDKNEDFYSSGCDMTAGLPIVVIINPLSASASEIVAGALQDHKRAQIIGEKSFGKGSVQKTFNLNNGDVLKLTIGHYSTPSGRIIQDVGLQPDIVVEDNLIISETKEFADLEQNQAKYKIIKDKKYDYQLIRALDVINTIHFIKKKS